MLALLFTVSCTSLPAAPVDLSGQWTLTMEPDFKGGQQRVECVLQQQGEEFTIKCGASGEEMKGRVSGSSVTWSFSKTGVHPMPQDRLVLSCDASLRDAGTSLKGTWRLMSSVVNEKGNFEMRRKPSNLSQWAVPLASADLARRPHLGTKPRVAVAFQGWWVWGLGGRLGADAAASVSAGFAASSDAALALALTAFFSSFSRQQRLYFLPDPQWQGSLRPGRAAAGSVIEESVPHHRDGRHSTMKRPDG